MIQRLILTLTTVCIFTCSFAGQSGSDSDFQVWNETTFSIPFIRGTEKAKPVDRVSLLLLGTVRLGQNRLYPVDRRIGAGIDVRINKYFTFSPTYLYRYSEAVRDRGSFEHRIRFDLTAEKKFKHFSLRDRNRVEYRMQHSRSDFVRYRNKVSLRVPVKKDEKEIFAPFVANEFFYSSADKSWSSNEFSAGIGLKLRQNTSAEFFYVYRTNDTGSIRQIHGIGANFKIVIR